MEETKDVDSLPLSEKFTLTIEVENESVKSSNKDAHDFNPKCAFCGVAVETVQPPDYYHVCSNCSKQRNLNDNEQVIKKTQADTNLLYENQLKCEVCQKTFSRKEHYKNHVRWHSGQTPHQCHLCSKKYTRREHLENHLRTHDSDSPLRCHVCSKIFTRKEHYTNHVRWHTGYSPHKCEFCLKTFTRKEHLVNHVRQHTGSSPHVCIGCGRSFVRKEHLKTHLGKCKDFANSKTQVTIDHIQEQ